MSTRSRSITTAILAALYATAGSLQAQRAASAGTARTNAVVLIVSGAGRDSGRTRPGFEMDELSQAWHIFTSNGFAVTIASPQGGPVQSDRFDRTSGYNAAFLADSSAMRALHNTTPTAGLRADRYDAMFVVGGKGAMFDLPADTALARLAGAMYDRGAVVSAVCHGPAGLVRARTRDGRSLLAGRAVTGFSNEEERVFGKKWAPQFTFMLEDEIRGLGARWEEAALMLPHVAVSERLITGQNPYSTAATSEAVVRALGKAPIARTPWQDERSVNFAAMALTGDALTTRRELARTYKELSVDLIGLLGYYQLQTASDETAVRRALTLMELAAPYMPQTELTLGLAEAYHRLGRTSDARQLVRSVLAAHPDQPAAKALLDKLGT
jgi:putative intracellular protease/amidase